jgi:hypothetical protein
MPDITEVACYVASISRAEDPVTTPIFKLGGNPVFVSHIEQPACKHCGQNMDFIGQIRLDSPLQLSNRYQMAYVFMCLGQLDERGWLVCPTWESFSGANMVLLQMDRGLALVPGTDARYPDYRVALAATPEPDVDVSDSDLDEDLSMQVAWATKIGGVPAWVQNNETPHCPHCGKPMRFVAQIDAEPDGPLPADQSLWPNVKLFDFGDVGIGYVFVCPGDCSSEGAFLWQCG